MTITLTREEAQQVLDALKWFEQRFACTHLELIDTIRARLSAPEPTKLWLWKNFVDGKPEYWAFDNPYPTNLEDGDPQTLGQPCGYAIFKPSRDGSNGRTEEQVLREMASVKLKPQLEPKPVAIVSGYFSGQCVIMPINPSQIFNSGTAFYTAPPQREWVGLTPEEAREISLANRPYVIDMVYALEAKLKEKNS